MVKSVSLRRLVNLGTALVVITSIASPNTMPIHNDLIANAVRFIGAALLFTSVALAMAIHASYPERHDKPEDFERLYTEGPYRLCRHPFYSLMMLAQFSFALTFRSLAGLIVSMIMIPLWLALIRVEERELVGRWGEEYLKYAKEVPSALCLKILWAKDPER